MSLKVIGAGLGRTGTLSLKTALEKLGIGRSYHMAELLPNPNAPALWVKAADGQADWNTIFDGYAATVDYPGCTFWRELSAFYPEAKIILSVRDAEKWFESTQATIFSAAFLETMLGSPLKEFLEKTVIRDFSDRIHDRDFMVGYFNRRNAEVEAALPKDRLLVYDVAQGWEPLCRFLGVPVPDEPFPRVNAREDMAAVVTAATLEGGDGLVASLQSSARERLQAENQS